MKKVILSIVFAIGIVFSDIVYFEYTCITDENWPTFLGFPFVQSTNTSWIFSMSGELFLRGLLCNILFWGVLIYIFVFFIERITVGKFYIAKWISSLLLMFLALFISIISLLAIDWRMNWDHDNFKRDYYQTELDCERSFHFF